jgi:hypothetical protein
MPPEPPRHRTIPRTHWADPRDISIVRECADRLNRDFDSLTAVNPVEYWKDFLWLLRAARMVDIGTDRHTEIEAVVIACGGAYDFDESGWLLLW